MRGFSNADSGGERGEAVMRTPVFSPACPSRCEGTLERRPAGGREYWNRIPPWFSDPRECLITATGSYSVSVKVTDGNGGSYTETIRIDALGYRTHGPGEQIGVAPLKKKFTLNFGSGGRDTLMLTMISYPEFGFLNKTEFDQTINGKDVKVFISNFYYDWIRMIGNKGTSAHGRLIWNLKNGMLKYIAKGASLSALLEPFGASNSTVIRQVIIPIWFEIDGVKFGGNISFSYNAKAGKKGVGK